ncbi:AbrB/MazE/SpoVT family DNA-binding domain-containing protein [Oscillatoria sp. CS-180]|uniref:AbrB/MazE/SpoVT family DNA-binding domain-containing protein n=1 Tax=Oscillatoria sp. CS-180 TaxID=3021720 RepID=UPI00232C58CC|nr:AbrB/MazE/SpoVT family DNA-binding domain-containing protein [Oscillatoria sp. CS-180]MDB9526982.1 AbrB/MazE/SpoVT family DNA-binding domain-containing protein [Oscillatoria sp. CS-180]
MLIENSIVALGPNGRLLLPLAIRKSLNLSNGDRFVLAADPELKHLSLQKLDKQIMAAEGLYRNYASDTSVVDELITERRSEAAAESHPE